MGFTHFSLWCSLKSGVSHFSLNKHIQESRLFPINDQALQFYHKYILTVILNVPIGTNINNATVLPVLLTIRPSSWGLYSFDIGSVCTISIIEWKRVKSSGVGVNNNLLYKVQGALSASCPREGSASQDKHERKEVGF
jgi:hypothetical protein